MELLVSAAVIVPIVLLIPTLANMLLLQTEAHKASRYVAWERTAYTQSALQEKSINMPVEVQDRFLRYAQSGFGTSSVRVESSWRDWGKDAPGTVTSGSSGYCAYCMDNDSDTSVADSSLVDYQTDVNVRLVASSATDGHLNASSTLANKGGSNAIELNTMQSGTLALPVRSASSLLSAVSSGPPSDPVTGLAGYYMKSSSALVVDSWVPANDSVFHDRVSDIAAGNQGSLGWLQAPAARFLRPFFREVSDHVFVDPATSGVDSPFDMVDPNQSTVLPQYLVEP